MIRLALIATALLVPALALAHPHKPKTPEPDIADKPVMTQEVEELSERIDKKLSKHKLRIARSAARLKRNMEKDTRTAKGDISEELDAVADMLEDAFAEDGLFRDLAAMMGDFAEDIDIDTDNGKTVLRFDGATVGQIQTHKNRNSDDRVSISGLGKNLTLERETIVKNGKSKTRIVIEMDGEDEVEITLPEID